MGLLCKLVFQPVIKLVQIVISVIEFILVQVCQLIQQVVAFFAQVLQYLCNTVVQTVCNAVCSVVCGLCDLFCGIFGCDCGCENICNSVCNTVTNLVCAWTYVLTLILQFITTLICNYILQGILTILNLVEAIVTMVLTWICTLIGIIINWFLCWTYLGEIFNNTDPRRFLVAPKIVRNSKGHSDWFVYVNNPNADGVVDQNAQGYILSDEGKPLVPVVNSDTGDIAYLEVVTRGDFITGRLKTLEGHDGQFVPGQPLLYYPNKVMEIASHLFGDVFATAAGDDGTGTDFHKNLLTYNANVQAWLASASELFGNLYNQWGGKYTNTSSGTYFGDQSISDMGMRVDVDSCSHPTNTFLNLVNGEVQFTPAKTDIAEEMSCSAGQLLSFDQNNFLLLNKESSSSVTTYFVTKFSSDETATGCNQWLGYTIISFQSNSDVIVARKVIAFKADTNQMMRDIVSNIAAMGPNIIRVAETYLHECGHQCGLLHDTDAPDCENDKTLHISKVMNPGGSVRRAYTRFQWCMIRYSGYITGSSPTPFTQAPELPDSGSVPPPAGH